MVSLFSELEISSRVFIYCEDHGRRKELELLFACYPVWSYNYACIVIRNRFKFGEGVILQDSVYAYHYVIDVIDDFDLEKELIDGESDYEFTKNDYKSNLELIQ